MRSFIVALAFLLSLLSMITVAQAHPHLDVNLLKTYKEYKVATKCKMLLTSGVRSKAHNKAVGGIEGSLHIKGLAIDVKPLRTCHKSLKELGKIASRYFTGVIVYTNHIHLDFRDKRYIDLSGTRRSK